MNDMEVRVQELLRDMAREIPVPGRLPERVIQRTRRRLAAVAIMTPLLLTAAVALSVQGARWFSAQPEKTSPADRNRPEAVAAIHIEQGARYVAAGGGSVWVVGGGISRVDSVSHEVVASFPGRTSIDAGSGIVVDGDAVWAFQGGGPTGAVAVTRIDPVTNEIVATIEPDLKTSGLWEIATGFHYVWASVHSGGAVVRINPATNEEEIIPVPRTYVHGMAALEGVIWIAASDADFGGCGERDAQIGRA